MSLSKLFQRIIWHNNTTPAINEDNLNAMSKAIDDIDDRVILIGDDVVTVIPQIQAYLEQAESIVEAVEELSQNPPYIGANGNWYVFDTTLEAYKDSGVDASITVDIADITMIAEGAQPYVTNTGTSTDPIFHLFLPRSPQGATGNGIANIAKTGTQGLVDTYTITMTDGTTYTFTVTNGQGIGDMTKAVYDSTNAVADAGGITDYVEGKVEPILNVLGAKNLLPNKLETQAINGITLTVNNDGTITANGTSTALVLVKLNNSFMLKKGSYLLSKPYQGASVTTSLLWLYKIDNTSIVYTNTKDVEFTLAEDTECFLNFIIANGITLDNEIIKPMIRPASIQDDTYAPYSLTNQQLTPYALSQSNPNLLDNPWFTINQRGVTTLVSGQYLVDRWSCERVSGTVSDNGIAFAWNGSSSYGYLAQKIEQMEGVENKTITLSINIDNSIYSLTGIFPAQGGATLFELFDVGNDQVGLTLEHRNGEYPRVTIRAVSTNLHTIKAVKLELGSVSTLAMDTAPSYATELLKCQRYFISFNPLSGTLGNGGATGIKFDDVGAVALNIPLPVAMRTTPALSVSDYGRVVYSNDTDFLPSQIIVDDVYNNNLRVYTPVEVSTGYKIAVWQDYKFTASADL